LLLAGYLLNASYKKHKEKFISERVKRSIKILVHGLIMTLITYILYPDRYIRFGILHFIFLVTLLSPLFAPYKTLTLIIFIISIIINYPVINGMIDTITGAKAHNWMMDWFPLNRNVPIILLGLVMGQMMEKPIKIDILDKKIPLITELGKNSLNLYTVHYIIMLVIYKIANI
jgi:uncharacterized membrane protein